MSIAKLKNHVRRNGKKIIEKEINTNDEYPEIIFEFFGGEPFLEFDLIKELYEYIWNPKFTKKGYALLVRTELY